MRPVFGKMGRYSSAHGESLPILRRLSISIKEVFS